MLHVLTTFNLQAGGAIGDFQSLLGKFEAQLRQQDLVTNIGNVGRRHRDTIMDTDEERDHEYFFLMSFRDRAQCDRAVALIQEKKPGTDAVHHALYSLIEQPVFSCWEDVPPVRRDF